MRACGVAGADRAQGSIGFRRALPPDLSASVRRGAAYIEGVGAAEEVLQESFVNIWHHAGSYVNAKSQPLTWLTSIVRNRCLDQLRRREVETVTMDDEEEDVAIAAEDPTPLEMLLSGADTRAVRNCVEALEPGQKQAIALAFFQGLSHSELSRQLR